MLALFRDSRKTCAESADSLRVLADEVRMQIVDKDPSVTEHVMKLGFENHASEFVFRDLTAPVQDFTRKLFVWKSQKSGK